MCTEQLSKLESFPAERDSCQSGDGLTDRTTQRHLSTVATVNKRDRGRRSILKITNEVDEEAPPLPIEIKNVKSMNWHTHQYTCAAGPTSIPGKYLCLNGLQVIMKDANPQLDTDSLQSDE